MNNIAFHIERLVQFGLKNQLINNIDTYVVRNTLLDLLNVSEPCEESLIETAKHNLPELPTQLLENLLDYAAEQNLFDNEINALRINFEARIMGTLMPRASEVASKFNALYKAQGPQEATKYFYDLCIKSNYIRTAQIAKNILWDYSSKYGNLEITINLTKPEKDPKTIALERLQPSASYPKCMLCIENIGYAGRVNFPARQNHRVVPISIGGEQWYLQYSPYVYYNEHCILFSEKHESMSISPLAFSQIFDFVQQFPHYTCGSNADLPIVGGSILSHTHFQGGNYTFPMQNAKAVDTYKASEFESLTIENLAWPVTTMRVKSAQRHEILLFASKVLSAWKNYTDESCDVIAFTKNGEELTPHNTITPILHFDNSTKEYVFDLVLRNNRTSNEHPDGIFHPHKEIHHIKKENIGLIEVMGLAILPARLETQCTEIAKVLQGELTADAACQNAPEHTEWIHYLQEKYAQSYTYEAALQIVKKEIGAKFETCLEHTGVFKQSKNGQLAFERFANSVGCFKI